MTIPIAILANVDAASVALCVSLRLARFSSTLFRIVSYPRFRQIYRLSRRAMDNVERGGGVGGRPKLRWNDCVKRDFGRANGKGKWKDKVIDRGRWRAMAKEAAGKVAS